MARSVLPQRNLHIVSNGYYTGRAGSIGPGWGRHCCTTRHFVVKTSLCFRYFIRYRANILRSTYLPYITVVYLESYAIVKILLYAHTVTGRLATVGVYWAYLNTEFQLNWFSYFCSVILHVNTTLNQKYEVIEEVKWRLFYWECYTLP